MSLLNAFFGKKTSPLSPHRGEQILDFQRLTQIASTQAQAYASAAPYPHAVLDGFIGSEVVELLANEFPARDDHQTWLDYNGNDADGQPLQRQKFHISDEHLLGPVTQRLLYELKSARFLAILSTLTGIPDLIPDALNHGGGIHMNCRGAILKVHADFNRHPNWHLHRRLNLLLYLNHDWQHSYGGDLELWDAGMQTCQKRVSPLAGRCVVFSTSSTSFHGHPDPVTWPGQHVPQVHCLVLLHLNASQSR